MNRDEMYLSLGVSDKVLQFGEAVLDELKPRFAGIEEIAEPVSYTHLRAPRDTR